MGGNVGLLGFIGLTPDFAVVVLFGWPLEGVVLTVVKNGFN